MAFTWPEFTTNQPLGAGRFWTAAFDSYDQYRDNVYYLVRILEGEVQIAEFMVKVGTEWAGEDWTVSTFLPGLSSRIAEVAATGETNTTYGG